MTAPDALPPAPRSYEEVLAAANDEGRALSLAHRRYVEQLKLALEAHRKLVDELSALAGTVPGGGYRSTPWGSIPRQLGDADLLAWVDRLAADDADVARRSSKGGRP